MQPKRKSNAELRKETRIILAYIEQQHEDIMDIYAKARAAKTKFYNEVDYYFTDTDRDNLIMLASAYSALLRRTYKIFVKEQGYEPTSFWDSYIRFAVFRQSVMFDETWKKIFKLDKELPKLIKKTSNPKYIEKIFTGDISLKWLKNELGGGGYEVYTIGAEKSRHHHYWGVCQGTTAKDFYTAFKIQEEKSKDRCYR